MKLSPFAACFTLAMSVCIWGQQLPALSGIQGQVVNLVTGDPVRKAEVKLSPVADGGLFSGAAPAGKSAYAGVTDAEGKYNIENVAPGLYSLSATRSGFLESRYGARSALQAGTTLKLPPGEPLKGMVVKITPQGIVAGKVMDDDGEPIANSLVQVFKESYVRGWKMLLPVGSAVTNDRGEYRVANLNPARYVVQANPPGDRKIEGAPKEELTAVYFPGNLEQSQAARIKVGPGAEVAGIDIPLRRVPVVRVKGRLIDGATGKPLVNTPVSLTPIDSLIPRNVVPIKDDGKFEMPAVTAGSYILLTMGPAPFQMTVVQPVEVRSRDIENLDLTVMTPAPVPGVIVVDGDKKLSVNGIQVVLTPSGGMNFYGTATGKAQDDGKFVLKNLSPVKYNLALVGLPEGAWIKSVLVSGREVLGKEIDWSSGMSGNMRIVLSGDAATVSGLVQRGDVPAGGVTVVLLPADVSKRHDIFDKMATTDQFGSFTIRGIAPMEYKVFAFEDLDLGAWQDPDLMNDVESLGEKVVSTAGGAVNVQLKSIPRRE